MPFYNQPIFINFILWAKRLWFLWLPVFLAVIFYETWLNQVRSRFIRNISWVLLEIKLPRDIFKSPKAMETVLSSLYSTFEGNFWMRNYKGFLPNWYSLEMVGVNGGVHFFIRTQKSFRNLVESQVYAQYPDVEIVEVSDYTYASDYENFEKWNLWGVEFCLNKPDPYPIKTYVDFGLHESMVKEEQKVNPLVSFLEFMGSLKEGEQVWFQVLIRGAKKEWAEEAKKLVDKLMGREIVSVDDTSSEKRLSKGEAEVISAIERNTAKIGFETGIRAIYLARRDVFNSVNIASVIGLMNQYNSLNLNGFKPACSTAAGFLFKTRREATNKIIMLDAFRKRGCFYSPHRRVPFVLNTEELATIYHFPGRVAETPTFGRVESKKSEPPATLPV